MTQFVTMMLDISFNPTEMTYVNEFRTLCIVIRCTRNKINMCNRLNNMCRRIQGWSFYKNRLTWISGRGCTICKANPVSVERQLLIEKDVIQLSGPVFIRFRKAFIFVNSKDIILNLPLRSFLCSLASIQLNLQCLHVLCNFLTLCS